MTKIFAVANRKGGWGRQQRPFIRHMAWRSRKPKWESRAALLDIDLQGDAAASFGLETERRCITRRGLLPETLQPILEKRIAIKAQFTNLTQLDGRRQSLKSRSTALK